MERISEKQLEYLVERLNKLTGSPLEPWTKDADGKYHANGHYILCPTCRGSGADAIELDRYLCRECGGLGEVYVPAKVAA